MMNLQNFEEYIDGKILSRGENYFKHGYITSLEHDGDDWVAEVEGSEIYTVNVSLSDDGEVLESYCDCPYDFGGCCKHEVAVFFALKEKGDKLSTETKSAKDGKKAEKENLQNILAKLDKPALISLITEYAQTHKPMKNEILFRYAKKENAEAGEYVTAVSSAVALIEEMMKLPEYCDGSDGYIGGAIDEAIEEIRETVFSVPKNHGDGTKIFDMVFNHALDNIFDEWTDLRLDLMSAIVPLCYEIANRERLENYLSVKDKNANDKRSKSYDYRQKQEIQLSIINLFDDETAAKNYIENNLDHFYFRCMAIETATEEKNFAEAEKLCADGEAEHADYGGYVMKFRELRYSVYEAANNMPEKKKLALELMLNGDFTYYIKYKELHSNDEWASVSESVLTKIENGKGRHIYEKVLVHEKHKPRLLNSVDA